MNYLCKDLNGEDFIITVDDGTPVEFVEKQYNTMVIGEVY